MKLKKIANKAFECNVAGQGCGNDCKVKVWSGKKEADGWEAGCWYTYQYTSKTNPFL